MVRFKVMRGTILEIASGNLHSSMVRFKAGVAKLKLKYDKFTFQYGSM